MNKLTSQKTMFSLATMSLIGLMLPLKTILAHGDEHHHHQPAQKTDNNQAENLKIDEQKIETSPSPKTNTSQQPQNQTINVTLHKSTQFNLIQNKSELVFLLLVVNPIILKVIKQKIHQK